MNSIVQSLQKDCEANGRGRKKWWAEQLGVPALTLSHWLAGRQKPRGENAVAIYQSLEQIKEKQHKKKWVDCLWDCYYSGQEIPLPLLPLLILEILSLSVFEVRTLALVSRMIERKKPDFPEPESARLKNILGWLLTVSGQKPSFSPVRHEPVQNILKYSTSSEKLKKYFKGFQTAAGKKWRVLDCPLQSLKDSLP